MTAKVGRKYDLPFVQLVDGKGEMTKETPWAGMFCKKADPEVLKALRESGLLFCCTGIRAQLPALLALRYTADLLCT